MQDLVKKTRTGGHSLILQFKKEDETETPMTHTGNTPSLIHPSEMNIWKRQGEIWTIYVTSKINTEGVGTSHTRNNHSSLNIKFIVLSKEHLRICWVFQKLLSCHVCMVYLLLSKTTTKVWGQMNRNVWWCSPALMCGLE